MDILTASRVCSYALNTMCNQLGLGNLAHHFDGETLSEWAILFPEVRALRGGRGVASIELTDSLTKETPSFDLYIVVPDVYSLVRDKHVAEFRPEQYGLHINTLKDWLGVKQPDLIVEWTVGMDEVRQGPARPIGRSVTGPLNVTVRTSV